VPFGCRERSGEVLFISTPSTTGIASAARVVFAVESGVASRVRVVVVWLLTAWIGQPYQ
jgi:hypothetical protein